MLICLCHLFGYVSFSCVFLREKKKMSRYLALHHLLYSVTSPRVDIFIG